MGNGFAHMIFGVEMIYSSKKLDYILFVEYVSKQALQALLLSYIDHNTEITEGRQGKTGQLTSCKNCHSNLTPKPYLHEWSSY